VAVKEFVSYFLIKNRNFVKMFSYFIKNFIQYTIIPKPFKVYRDRNNKKNAKKCVPRDAARFFKQHFTVFNYQ
jgi:hypothetical protein